MKIYFYLFDGIYSKIFVRTFVFEEDHQKDRNTSTFRLLFIFFGDFYSLYGVINNVFVPEKKIKISYFFIFCIYR